LSSETRASSEINEIASGPLAATSLSELLARAYAERLTGALQLTGQMQQVDQVWFRGGYPVAVLLSSGAERLGQVLLEAGFLDRDGFLRAQALPQEGAARIGQILLQARLLTRTALKEGLRAQVRRRLFRLFFAGTGPPARYQLFRCDHDQGLETGEPLRCDPWRAVYHGVRRVWDADRLRTALLPLSGQEFRLDPTLATAAAAWLSPPEAGVVTRLSRGFVTLPELEQAAPLPGPALQALLVASQLFASLEVRPATPERQRVVREAAKLTELPPRPTDEPLRLDADPGSERAVLLHAGAPKPALQAARPPGVRRDRPIVIVPLAATAPPASVAPPPEPAMSQPSPEPAPSRQPPAPRLPPLRTSLPASRLRSK
jgi:hypothetical protein